MGEESNNVQISESYDYRWLVIIVKNNILGGGIYTDIKEVGRKVGLSDTTIRKRMKEANGLGRIKVNGYTITKFPYYKSKRGFNNDNQ